MNLDGRGIEEELVGIEEKETVIRIYYMRRTIFNKRKIKYSEYSISDLASLVTFLIP